jgi:hypothetical protein
MDLEISGMIVFDRPANGLRPVVKVDHDGFTALACKEFEQQADDGAPPNGQSGLRSQIAEWTHAGSEPGGKNHGSHFVWLLGGHPRPMRRMADPPGCPGHMRS